MRTDIQMLALAAREAVCERPVKNLERESFRDEKANDQGIVTLLAYGTIACVCLPTLPTLPALP